MIWTWWVALCCTLSFSLEYPSDFDCPMRDLALEFASYIQPQASAESLQSLANALNGGDSDNCNATMRSTMKIKHKKQLLSTDLDHQWQNSAGAVFIDAINGNDKYCYRDHSTNSYTNIKYYGTKEKPFLTINCGLTYLRAINDINKDESPVKMLLLRKGRYYLSKPIELTSQDSNLIISNYNNEKAEISGAVLLKNLSWTQMENSNNIFCTFIDKKINNISISEDIPGLRVNGSRAIRAKYPNFNPENGFGPTVSAIKWLPPKSSNPLPDYTIEQMIPYRNETTQNFFYYYTVGIGGTACENFTPQAGYWCSSSTNGGGAFTYRVPTGLVFNQTILPHSPYQNYPNQAIFQVWHPGKWSSWMFSTKNYRCDK